MLRSALAKDAAALDAVPEPTPEWSKAAFAKQIRDMSSDELAAALRPVTVVDGETYILAQPDYEAAAKAKELLGKTYSGGGSSQGSARTAPPPLPSEDDDYHFCCGYDDRSTKISTNPTGSRSSDWPYRTWLVLGLPRAPTFNPFDWAYSDHLMEPNCTAQLIGSSTAVSSAHCFSDGNGGFFGVGGRQTWAAGADSTLPSTIPSGFPEGYGCYWVTVPYAFTVAGWDGSDDYYGANATWDYAVMDFRSYCVPHPGNTVGWMGWGSYSDSDLQGHLSTSYGYPARKADNTANTAWPQLTGMTSRHMSVSTSYPNLLIHALDANSGDSGRGTYQYEYSDYRVVGIHHDHWDQGLTALVDRRVTGDVASFIINNSEFHP